MKATTHICRGRLSSAASWARPRPSWATAQPASRGRRSSAAPPMPEGSGIGTGSLSDLSVSKIGPISFSYHKSKKINHYNFVPVKIVGKELSPVVKSIPKIIKPSKESKKKVHWGRHWEGINGEIVQPSWFLNFTPFIEYIDRCLYSKKLIEYKIFDRGKPFPGCETPAEWWYK